jgi:arsenate reductase-like glutaredoxin family protein
MGYENIEHNIKAYFEAKELFPIISDYENGLASMSTMGKFGLSTFADFYNFKKRQEERGFSLIDKVTYRNLKPLIEKHTTSFRFKTYINNRTQKDFIKILEDVNKFDRLLNGRIVSRGRRGLRRDNKKMEGLKHCIVPIMNYMISNGLSIDKISSVDDIGSITKWYSTKVLEIKNVPVKEMEITRDMITNFIDVIDRAEIDYRKLNVDYITDTLSSKLKSLMIIPNGTTIVAKTDLFGRWSTQVLTKNKSYVVEGCSVSNGKLRVMVKNDDNSLDHFDYHNFEDMALKREQLLNQLLG